MKLLPTAMCVVAVLTTVSAHAQKSAAGDTYVVTRQAAEDAVDGRAAAAQLAATYSGELVQADCATVGAYTERSVALAEVQNGTRRSNNVLFNTKNGDIISRER